MLWTPLLYQFLLPITFVRVMLYFILSFSRHERKVFFFFFYSTQSELFLYKYLQARWNYTCSRFTQNRFFSKIEKLQAVNAKRFSFPFSRRRLMFIQGLSMMLGNDLSETKCSFIYWCRRTLKLMSDHWIYATDLLWNNCNSFRDSVFYSLENGASYILFRRISPAGIISKSRHRWCFTLFDIELFRVNIGTLQL